MHKLGETRTERRIGARRSRVYVWVRCPICLKERWILRRYGIESLDINCHPCTVIKLHDRFKGSNSPRWKGGRLFNQFYWRVWVPPDDPFRPMADKYGYILEHRLVVARHLGRCLERWEVVHHINRDKVDNRVGNLKLLPDKVYHAVETNMQREIVRLQKEILKWQKLIVWLLQSGGVPQAKR